MEEEILKKEVEQNLTEIREFTTDEIAEINNYVLSQIPQSVLPRLFVLTEEPIKKAKAFVAIHRILYSCMNFVTSVHLRKKINNLLTKANGEYEVLYPLITSYEDSNSEYYKSFLNRRIRKIIFKGNENINFLISIFLVFAEKIELIPIETVSGLKMEEETGINIYGSLSKLVED